MNSKLTALSGELGTPEFQDAFNELVGIAQRGEHVKVYNGTGGNLAKGTLVAVSGYSTANAALSVAAADQTTGPAALVLSEDVDDTECGIAYANGVVTGLNTSAFSAVGSLVYLGASGALATTAPVTTGYFVQAVGVVTVKHASTGAVWFNIGGWRMIGDIPTGTVIGSATLADMRGGKITLNGVNPTRVLFQDPDAATILGTDDAATKAMDNGLTLVVNPDGDGDDTVTFAATAATSVSGASPATDIHAETDNKFLISVDGDDAEEVTLTLDGLTTGGAIATEMQTKIQALGGTKASVTVAFTTVYTITSASKGTNSSVVVTDAPSGNIAEELKLGEANGGTETAGTGDFADASAATAAEIAAAIAARADGWTATAEGNKVRITSESTGKDSSLVVNAASTADLILGITGSAYGAQGLGYDTDMADADYLVLATLDGVAQANLAAKCLGITSKATTGFQVECETAAATHDVDVLIVGVAA
jgi:hypothetical protein